MTIRVTAELILLHDFPTLDPGNKGEKFFWAFPAIRKDPKMEKENISLVSHCPSSVILIIIESFPLSFPVARGSACSECGSQWKFLSWLSSIDEYSWDWIDLWRPWSWDPNLKSFFSMATHGLPLACFPRPHQKKWSFPFLYAIWLLILVWSWSVLIKTRVLRKSHIFFPH